MKQKKRLRLIEIIERYQEAAHSEENCSALMGDKTNHLVSIGRKKLIDELAKELESEGLLYE